MTSFEIPKVESHADVGDPLENVLGVCHFLLTALLSRDQALLHAEYYRPENKALWYLRSRPNGAEGEDEAFAMLPSSVLQSFAGRLAVMVDLHQTEGGHGRVVLTQQGRKHECRIFVSNCRESGAWVRIYARLM